MPKKNDYAIPPGVKLKEWMNENNVTVADFAAKTQQAEMWVEDLLAGDVFVDAQTAIVLEMITGISLGFWISQENAYRFYLQYPPLDRKPTWLEKQWNEFVMLSALFYLLLGGSEYDTKTEVAINIATSVFYCVSLTVLAIVVFLMLFG